MNITKVIVQNFLTLQRAEIDLADRGLLLIQGDNKDDTSADSNGAGKSSIADAICWAIYGVTARGVSTDAVVNKKSKKDCSVEIRLKDGADEYRIIRYRKDATYKNQTLVQKKSPNPGEIPLDLHKGTERETQEVIDKLVGCSLEVFQAAVYAGQEKMPDLPSMTDKQLKLMIEEAAGVEVLARAHVKAREKLNEATRKEAEIRAKVTNAQDLCKSLEEDLKNAIEQVAKFEDERKPQAKKLLADVMPIQGNLDALRDKIADELALDRGKELLDIATRFASVKHEREELDRLNAVVTVKQKAFATAEAVARLAKQSHTNAVEALRTISDKVGQPCGECGKAYCEHDIEAVKKLREYDLESATAELRKAAATLKTAKDETQAASDAATAYRATMTDVTEMAARQKVLQDEVAQIEKMKKEATAMEVEIERIKTAAKLELTKPNPYTMVKETTESRLKSIAATQATLEATLKEAEKEVALADSVVKVFGPSGVRAHILDTVTPYLNDRTSHYLSALADGNIKAVWNTLTKSAKGELKEKFSIEVVNDKGAESFEGLSGGEKRKVRLACAMALQDMVASRATKPINIFVADEVDHALDESGLERLMTVLNDKAKERGTVLVISHNSLSDWIDNVITVTKEKGYGTVSGATAA
jgi:DNA repair exonuclease SbcCD ATPase subunit